MIVRAFAPALVATFAVLAASAGLPAFAAAPPGSTAPDFSLPATDGRSVKLSEFRGKWVVLEWVNPGCPYVQKHYVSRNMQTLQRESGGRGAVWLAVNSTNPSHADYLKPAAMGQWMTAQGAAAHATLMDEAGQAGRAYTARTTPQMVIINPDGKVVYHGAIDDRRSSNPDDVKTARNHVRAALGEAMAGKPVSVASTTPYGCSVKY
ncbi:MAG: thioredoxin family protein [Burkholderiales bacterium]|nr:thioredoxin family protein [Burkholderiales bacterium]